MVAHGPISSRGQFFVLRLLPGEDPVLKLSEWAVREKISAASIVSAVGSFTVAHLRYAAKDTVAVIPGPLEVVSFSGTLESTGMHVHAVVSDGEGKTFGGHFVKGCIVRTTLELVLIELTDLTFTREDDGSSGYSELQVRRRN